MNRAAGRALLVVAMVLLAVWLRNRGAAAAAAPESAVQAWYDAAGRGDDRAYLAATAGDLRANLDAVRRQQGADAFRRGLRASLSDLRGLAVSRADAPGAETAEIEVELVFADRNERQRVSLERKGAGWRVVRTSGARNARPPVAYGAPVNE